MANKFGIPEEELIIIRERDKRCVYCHKKMIYPYTRKNHNDSATLEHLENNEPFHWKNELKIETIAYCCGQCNSSRGKKLLSDWFETTYCITRGINENTVTEPVKNYIIHKRKKDYRN